MSPLIDAYGATDIGCVRKKNEDVFKILKHYNLFSIADGMGGHRAGDIAATVATNHICNLLLKTLKIQIPIDQIISHFKLAIKEANDRVYNLSRSNLDFLGMGTTICCLYFHAKEAIFAHIGDSRIYRYNNNTLTQLTKDHSLINKLKDQNKIFNVRTHKNIITKAIGTHRIVEPSIDTINFNKGDLFLMCTDGLTDYLADKIIKKLIENNLSSKDLCNTLIKQAKINGSSDNITALVVKII